MWQMYRLDQNNFYGLFFHWNKKNLPKKLLFEKKAVSEKQVKNLNKFFVKYTKILFIIYPSF